MGQQGEVEDGGISEWAPMQWRRRRSRRGDKIAYYLSDQLTPFVNYITDLTFVIDRLEVAEEREIDCLPGIIKLSCR